LRVFKRHTPAVALASQPEAALLRGVAGTSDTLHLGFTRGFESGDVLDRIYAAEASGRTLFGRWLDAHVLRQPLCDELRERHRLLRTALHTTVSAQLAQNGAIHVLDLGCGPARATLALLAQLRTQAVSATCVDLDGACLRSAAALAQAQHVEAVSFERTDAFDISALAHRQHAHTVLVSDLFEYVGDDVMRRTLAQIRDQLGAAGVVFTTQTQPTADDPLERVLRGGCPIRLRPIATVEAWVRGAGFSEIQLTQTRRGRFAVFCAQTEQR
jgi:SAM-dependent methyltransferase